MRKQHSSIRTAAQQDSAFTLVELLVVVSIIALLLSILLPSMGQIRSTTEAIVCQSQMRSVHRITMFYAHDHDSYLPMVRSQDANGGRLWIETLRHLGYTDRMTSRDEDVFTCPTNAIYVHSANFLTTVRGTYGVSFLNWGQWYAGTPMAFGATGNTNMNIEWIDNPSRHFLYADKKGITGADGNTWVVRYNIEEVYPDKDIVASGGFSIDHDGTTNMVFYDGHTQRRSLDEIPASPPPRTETPVIAPW